MSVNSDSEKFIAEQGRSLQELANELNTKSPTEMRHIPAGDPLYKDMLAPAIDHVTEEILKKIEPMNPHGYILRIDKPMASKDIQQLKHMWVNAMKESPKPTLLCIVPEAYNLEPLQYATFDFAIALKFLRAGYKVQREGWHGYLYMKEGIIYYNVKNTEWIPTQKEVTASNWRKV